MSQGRIGHFHCYFHKINVVISSLRTPVHDNIVTAVPKALTSSAAFQEHVVYTYDFCNVLLRVHLDAPNLLIYGFIF